MLRMSNRLTNKTFISQEMNGPKVRLSWGARWALLTACLQFTLLQWGSVVIWSTNIPVPLQAGPSWKGYRKQLKVPCIDSGVGTLKTTHAEQSGKRWIVEIGEVVSAKGDERKISQSSWVGARLMIFLVMRKGGIAPSLTTEKETFRDKVHT